MLGCGVVKTWVYLIVAILRQFLLEYAIYLHVCKVLFLRWVQPRLIRRNSFFTILWTTWSSSRRMLAGWLDRYLVSCTSRISHRIWITNYSYHKNISCHLFSCCLGPIIFHGYLDTSPALEQLAATGTCLLMYSSRYDQLIPFARQKKLYQKFAAISKSNCSIFNENPYQVHDRSPWVDDHFPENLKRFLEQKIWLSQI